MDLQGADPDAATVRNVYPVYTRQIQIGDGCDYAGRTGILTKHGNRVDDPAQDQCSGMLNTGYAFPVSGKITDPVRRLSENLITEEIMMRKNIQAAVFTQSVNILAECAGVMAQNPRGEMLSPAAISQLRRKSTVLSSEITPPLKDWGTVTGIAQSPDATPQPNRTG